MLNIVTSCVLLLSAAWTLADSGTDTVNERIPVSKAQLEAHWRLDCASAQADLYRTLAAEPADCGVAEPLRRTLQLCAFIYQPPGSEPGRYCPDFGRFSRLLEQQRCEELHDLLQPQANCPPPLNP